MLSSINITNYTQEFNALPTSDVSLSDTVQEMVQKLPLKEGLEIAFKKYMTDCDSVKNNKQSKVYSIISTCGNPPGSLGCSGLRSMNGDHTRFDNFRTYANTLKDGCFEMEYDLDFLRVRDCFLRNVCVGVPRDRSADTNTACAIG